MPTAEAQREICDDRVNLLRWGFPVTDFAYPFTVAQPRVESLVSRCGYNSGLGAGQVTGAGSVPKLRRSTRRPSRRAIPSWSGRPSR